MKFQVYRVEVHARINERDDEQVIQELFDGLVHPFLYIERVDYVREVNLDTTVQKERLKGPQK